MNIKVTVSIGLAGCKQSQTIDYDDDDWKGMTDKDRDEVMREIAFEMVEWNYREE